AGGRTRRVDQDAVERLAVPPGLRCARVAGQQARIQAQPLQVLADAVHARRRGVQRGEVDLRAFQQVAGLAARCGAGVEDTQAAAQVGEVGGDLRGAVLHREGAV